MVGIPNGVDTFQIFIDMKIQRKTEIYSKLAHYISLLKLQKSSSRAACKNPEISKLRTFTLTELGKWRRNEENNLSWEKMLITNVLYVKLAY